MIYEINGIELDIDMGDADFVERYEDAFIAMEKTERELQKVGKQSDIVKGYCQMFCDLFDGIFGAGTSEKLFAGKRNINHTHETYDQFIDACSQEAKKVNAGMKKLYDKYTPNKKRK